MLTTKINTHQAYSFAFKMNKQALHCWLPRSSSLENCQLQYVYNISICFFAEWQSSVVIIIFHLK